MRTENISVLIKARVMDTVSGLLLFSTWGWKEICVPDIFSWTFGFTLLNACHLVHALYVVRPVRLNPELESVFVQLFRPLGISRLAFKKLTSSDYAEIFSLHTGEAYAVQNITRTDRLSLLLTGKVTRTILRFPSGC